MVVEKKLTMKGLAQEISILREQVSEIDFLKQKIVELEKAQAKEFVFLKQKILNLEATLKSLWETIILQKSLEMTRRNLNVKIVWTFLKPKQN